MAMSVIVSSQKHDMKIRLASRKSGSGLPEVENEVTTANDQTTPVNTVLLATGEKFRSVSFLRLRNSRATLADRRHELCLRIRFCEGCAVLLVDEKGEMSGVTSFRDTQTRTMWPFAKKERVLLGQERFSFRLLTATW